MIITRTPFRISFFGGGSDYPAWYSDNGGAVLSTTIDKYCYVSCRYLPPFFDHKYRIVYSKIENVKEIKDINHPAVREVLNWSRLKEGVEIHHDGDLPARSGLGSSSSFTIGLVHALYALQGQMTGKEALAKDAIHIERELIGESVGSQDQIAAAYGGFNTIRFSKNGNFSVDPVIVPIEKIATLQSHLLLFFTGFSRIANEIAKSKIENINNKKMELKEIQGLVDEGLAILTSPRLPISDFGKLLDYGWNLKIGLSDKVTTSEIDRIYLSAKEAGAIGGKILGAGGGGFMLIFASPDRHRAIKEKLKHLIQVNFNFEDHGSKVVLYQPKGL